MNICANCKLFNECKPEFDFLVMECFVYDDTEWEESE